MINQTHSRILAVSAVLLQLLVGCASEKLLGTSTIPLKALSDGKMQQSLDAPMATQVVFSVDVWVLSVPFGTLSANEDFWKRIDEHAVDPGTYDLLYRSGVRVGEAALAERSALDKYIDNVITKQRFSATGTEVKNMQIEMKKDIPNQDVFHLNKYNERIGQTYEDSDNFINISFEPALRKQGILRLTCCPMVRSTRSFMRATPMNQTVVFTRETPEAIYDLNFKVDLSAENFLIAMPSPVATTSDVGGAFFTKAGQAEKMEQVLMIFVTPHEVQMSRVP